MGGVSCQATRKDLVVDLRGRKRDARVDHAVHPEGTQRPRAVIEVDDVGIVLIVIPHGIDLVAGAEGTDDGRVAGRHALNRGAVSLPVGDADPPGVERGAQEATVVRVAITGKGEVDGEGDGGGAGHAGMIPRQVAVVKGEERNKFLPAWG